MNKSTGILLALAAFFVGIIFGFSFAPIKKGMQIGNNCGNQNHYHDTKCADKDPDALEF